jgi:acetate kinase
VVERASCLGFEIDDQRNGAKITKVVQDIGAPGARHRVLVCQTDEQYEMARLCAEKDRFWA